MAVLTVERVPLWASFYSSNPAAYEIPPPVSVHLRTLFILLTLLGIWLGLQWKWIRARHAYLAEHPGAASAKTTGAPRMLWLFGQRGTAELNVAVEEFFRQHERGIRSYPDVDLARELFPEATVTVLTAFVPRPKGGHHVVVDTLTPGKIPWWNQPPAPKQSKPTQSENIQDPFGGDAGTR